MEIDPAWSGERGGGGGLYQLCCWVVSVMCATCPSTLLYSVVLLDYCIWIIIVVHSSLIIMLFLKFTVSHFVLEITHTLASRPGTHPHIHFFDCFFVTCWTNRSMFVPFLDLTVIWCKQLPKIFQFPICNRGATAVLRAMRNCVVTLFVLFSMLLPERQAESLFCLS